MFMYAQALMVGICCGAQGAGRSCIALASSFNITQGKASYRAALTRLRALKPEVEHLNLLLAHGQRKMQEDFRAWHTALLREHQSFRSTG